MSSMAQNDDEKFSTFAFTNLPELGALKYGGKILFATDDWFAEAENLLKIEEPLWKEGVYTSCGKWMDGWETRRKRKPGHDWCIIKLAFPGIIEGVDVDTAHFTGNYVPQISLQAACLTEHDEKIIPKRTCILGGEASEDEFKQIELLHSEVWEEILPMNKLRAGYPDTRHNLFEVENKKYWTHVRLNAYPDGGIARLRLYGTIIPNWNKIPKIFDLLGMENGAQCIEYSNAHYGHPRNITQQEKGLCMSDGWETARQPNRPPVLRVQEGTKNLILPGEEWAIFKLASKKSKIERIEIDTSHFIGNSPLTVELKTCENFMLSNEQQAEWHDVLTPQKITPNTVQTFRVAEINNLCLFEYLKIIMVPDGGISRIRVWGKQEY